MAGGFGTHVQRKLLSPVCPGQPREESSGPGIAIFSVRKQVVLNTQLRGTAGILTPAL